MAATKVNDSLTKTWQWHTWRKSVTGVTTPHHKFALIESSKIMCYFTTGRYFSRPAKTRNWRRWRHGSHGRRTRGICRYLTVNSCCETNDFDSAVNSTAAPWIRMQLDLWTCLFRSLNGIRKCWILAAVLARRHYNRRVTHNCRSRLPLESA